QAGFEGPRNRVMTPEVVIRSMLAKLASLNHRLPSGPAVMPPREKSAAFAVAGKFVTAPAVVMPPIEPSAVLDHRPLSGGVVIELGWLTPVPTNVVTDPAVVIRPIWLAPVLANHRAPSGPAVIPVGPWIWGSVNIDTAPLVVTRPMKSAPQPKFSWQVVNHS